MDYSPDSLKKIEQLAREMMSASEIGFLMGYDELLFRDDINTYGHPVRLAFMRVLAHTAHELRQNIRDAAIAGSPHSIAECQKQIISMLAELQS